MIDARRLCVTVLVLAFSAAGARAEIKVLLCSGDYGMWAQDRAKLIIEAVDKAAPGQAVFEVAQSYNFAQSLQAPGFAGRYDVIVVGDVHLGEPVQGAAVAAFNLKPSSAAALTCVRE